MNDILGETQPALRVCKMCGVQIGYTMIKQYPDWGPVFCNKCGEKNEAHSREKIQNDIFNSIVDRSCIPPEYMRWNNKKSDELGTERIISWMKENRKNSFYICGTNGRGKTHTVAACAYAVIKENFKTVYYMPVSRWLNDMMDAKMQGKSIVADIQNVSTIDLLVIDDIGKEKLSESKLELIYNIIDIRERQGKQTWFTSNFDIDQLAERLDANYGPAIVERIRRMVKSSVCKI
jgi:hypothetical protein